MENYENIIETIETAVHGFEVQIGVSPNRIVVSADVYSHLLSIDMVVGNMTEEKKIMGMDMGAIEFDRELFIEVGYMTNANSYKVGE